MVDEVFVDGVLGYALVNGAVRIDLYSVSPSEDNRKHVRQRLITTGDGVVQMYNTLTDLMIKLRDAGMVRMPVQADPRAGGGQEPGRQGGVSPNF